MRDELTSSRVLADDLNLERMADWLGPLASPVRLKLLRYLSRPHYLEEIAAHLRLTRQAARKHLDKLVEIGVLERKPGTRPSGPVTEYVINPQALFVIYDEFEKLSALRRDDGAALRTLAGAGGPRPPGAAGPCLTVVRGVSLGLQAPLDGGEGREWVVGRDERCDVPLPHDPYASGRHAQIRREGARFVLADLGSTNGTTHNWRRLDAGGEAPLRHGDVVGVGKTLLLFWGGDGPGGR